MQNDEKTQQNGNDPGAEASETSLTDVQPTDFLPEPRGRGRYSLKASSRFSRMRLGEILIELGLIETQDRDLALALGEQSNDGMLFGEWCLHLKLISPADLSAALAHQFGSLQPFSESFRFGEDLVAVSRPDSAHAEALRALSGRLMSRNLVEERKALAVSSAETGDGRSHIAANLAVCLAQAGWKTLLIDADLRAPRQHETFGVPQHPGLSRLLCGFSTEDVVRRIPALRNLSLITSGPLPPNPSDLLGRGELSALIQQAKGYYDVVLVDTPAGTRFADAELIAAAVDGILMIVRKNRTRIRKVRAFAESLSANGVPIVGTLVNSR